MLFADIYKCLHIGIIFWFTIALMDPESVAVGIISELGQKKRGIRVINAVFVENFSVLSKEKLQGSGSCLGHSYM